ncbi:MAG: hypothetical protein ACYC3H_09555 [Bellilinea sp.]
MTRIKTSWMVDRNNKFYTRLVGLQVTTMGNRSTPAGHQLENANRARETR